MIHLPLNQMLIQILVKVFENCWMLEIINVLPMFHKEQVLVLHFIKKESKIYMQIAKQQKSIPLCIVSKVFVVNEVAIKLSNCLLIFNLII
jgi:hypothetical protein